MAKPSRSQTKLFKKEIPQMPEGYYSSGPNPNLAKFVEEHATSYDPATDDYDVPPFDNPIKTTKATAIYNMHTYWSKKPHDAIREYIKHYTQPGDLILDPFCGSGGTALAALLEGRKAIAIDLSPAATFITKNYCTPVDVDELQQAFDKLEATVKPEMDWLYETRCDRCDGRAMTNYTVWSYVFECPRCLNRMPLFDCPEAEIPNKSGKGTKKVAVCPYCQKEGHLEEISTRSTKRFDPIPVLVNYECLDGCTPKRGQRLHNDPDPKKRDYFERFDLAKIEEIERKDIPYWVPPHRMMNVESDTEPWGDEWRPGRDFRLVTELFTKRNLWALACILDAIKRQKIEFHAPLKFALTGLLLGLSKMNQYRPNVSFPLNTMSGTYYLPQISSEAYVWKHYKNKIERLKKGYLNILDNVNSEKFELMISTQSCTNLEQIASNAIDFVFTDPPYGGNYQYGELNFIWESWLNFETYWHKNEIIVNKTRNTSEDEWTKLMQKAMHEVYRLLKPGHWISLCYHDTSEGTWQLVQDIMAETGFISEDIDKALFIDTGGLTYNQTQGQKVTKRDLVINFRKPRPGETRSDLTITGDEDEVGFFKKAQIILIDTLELSPGKTADHLYDELVSRMVRKGEFERHNFDNLLRSVAEEVRTPNGGGQTISRWYLLETVGEVDAAENRKEEDAARRLEAFMVIALKAKPELEGVHYSDLFEQYLPVQDKPRRLLADWLPEFFYRTPGGTWRPPKDTEERHQKQNLRTNGTLRRIKRFTNAILNSVPPAGRDRPENAATLANWINECRKAGLYNQGKLLYEQGGHSFDALSEKAQLEVRENYLICRRRLGKDDDKQMSLL